MSWIVFILIGLITKSFSSLLSKVILNNKSDPAFYIVGRWLLIGIFGVVLLAITDKFNFVLSLQNILLLALEALLSAGAVFYYFGLDKVELSRANILGTVSVLISIFIGSLFLGEILTLNKFFAFALIVVSFTILNGGKKVIEGKFNKFDVLIIIGSLFDPFIYVIDKKLIISSNPETILALAYLCASAVVLLLNIGRLKNALATYRDTLYWKIAVPDAFILFLSYLAIFSSFALGEISKSYIILQSQVLLVAIMGIIFLKERDNLGRKLIASFLCFIAMIIVV